MEIKKFLKGKNPNFCNSYMVLSQEAAVIIDSGECTEEMVDFLSENSDKERIILLTHCHFDHIFGANKLKEKTGVKIAAGAKEKDALNNEDINLANMIGENSLKVYPDVLLKDGEVLKIGDLEIKTIFTPGHTSGSVSYLIDDNLFSGDTLFLESVGRTDLPTGDAEQLKKSLNKLSVLSKEIKFFPGHGESTTLQHELYYNPFLR